MCVCVQVCVRVCTCVLEALQEQAYCLVLQFNSFGCSDFSLSSYHGDRHVPQQVTPVSVRCILCPCHLCLSMWHLYHYQTPQVGCAPHRYRCHLLRHTCLSLWYKVVCTGSGPAALSIAEATTLVGWLNTAGRSLSCWPRYSFATSTLEERSEEYMLDKKNTTGCEKSNSESDYTNLPPSLCSPCALCRALPLLVSWSPSSSSPVCLLARCSWCSYRPHVAKHTDCLCLMSGVWRSFISVSSVYHQ